MRSLIQHLVFSAMLFLPLLFGGCRQSDIDLKCDDSNTIKVSQHARDFFYFKTGTWWLYEQEGTGLTDSIWVSWFQTDYWNNLKLKGICKCGQGRCTEGAGIRLQNRAHSGSDYLCHYTLGTSLSEGTTAIAGETPNSRIQFSPLHGNWSYINDSQLVTVSGGSEIFENLDTLNVNSKTYFGILHKFAPDNNLGNTYLQETWFARNFFVVKFRKFDNTIWNLIDYNIVQ